MVYVTNDSEKASAQDIGRLFVPTNGDLFREIGSIRRKKNGIIRNAHTDARGLPERSFVILEAKLIAELIRALISPADMRRGRRLEPSAGINPILMNRSGETTAADEISAN